MPHFDKYAYEDTDCYGLKGKDLDSEAPRYPHSTPLTRREIEAVADYIIMAFVGRNNRALIRDQVGVIRAMTRGGLVATPGGQRQAGKSTGLAELCGCSG
jgi:hypothetical protein